MDPTYPLFSIVSFLCFVLVLSPLPWQFRVWNTGMCMYILWTASSCLIWFINSIIWKNNAADRAPIFCDISTRIIMGTGVAIPACSLCIQRRLYGITIAQAVTPDKYEKIRRVCVDLAICLGFPLFVMALAYIVQGRRYVIFEDVGCACYLYDVWPAFPIYTIWPLVLALISTVYCVMTFRSFARRRSQLKEFLDSGDSPIALNCYYRLMMLCCTEIIFTIPLASWILYLNFTKLTKYISWADTHSDFLIIETYPSIIWRNDKQLRISLEFGRWNIIICAIIFSAFFTFAEDSRNNYRAFSRKTAQRFGMKGTATRVNGTPGFSTRKNKDLVPMFPSCNKKRDSLLTSTMTRDDLPMNHKSSDENTAPSDVSFVSSSSSFASRSLPAILTLGETSPTSSPPPHPRTELGNANIV